MTATLTEPRSTARPMLGHAAGAGHATGGGTASGVPTASGLPDAPGGRSERGRGGGRGGAMSIDPRDRAQLADAPVPLRRVLALFRPHRARVAVVVAIIVVTSIVSLAQPFLVREVVDVALPRQDVRLLVLAVLAMVAVAAVTQLLGVVQTWLSTQVGQRVMHELRTRVFTHLQRQSLGFFTRTRGRRGPVPPHQRRQRHAGRRDLDRHVDRREPHDRRRHGGRDGRALVAPVAAVAPRHPAGPVADPQGRAPAPCGDRRAAAPPRRPQPPDRGGAVGERRPPGQDARHLDPHGRALLRDVRRARRPRAALAAGRPLADGDDADRLRRHPGAGLPRGRACPPRRAA